MAEVQKETNDRANEVATQLETIAAEIFMLAINSDERTSMRLESAIESVAKVGLSIKASQHTEYGID